MTTKQACNDAAKAREEQKADPTLLPGSSIEWAKLDGPCQVLDPDGAVVGLSPDLTA